MIHRLLSALTAIAVIMASATVIMIASCYALFSALVPLMGPALSAASVALLAVLVAAAAVLVVIGSLKKVPAALQAPTPQAAASGLMSRAGELLKDKSVLMTGAAMVLGFLATRNPKFFATLLKTMTEANPPPKKKGWF